MTKGDYLFCPKFYEHFTSISPKYVCRRLYRACAQKTERWSSAAMAMVGGVTLIGAFNVFMFAVSGSLCSMYLQNVVSSQPSENE